MGYDRFMGRFFFWIRRLFGLQDRLTRVELEINQRMANELAQTIEDREWFENHWVGGCIFEGCKMCERFLYTRFGA